MPKPRQILFVGAHPDDVELGAGCLISHFSESGKEIFVVILTDEEDLCARKIRREETLLALAKLGVQKENVLFCGFKDGFLEVSRATVSLFRELIESRHAKPDIVVTHTRADLHPDHQAASRLTAAAVRNAVILGFPILNSLLLNEFKPSLYHDVSSAETIKLSALGCHHSQITLKRIVLERVRHFHRVSGALALMPKAEAFDVSLPFGADASLSFLTNLVRDKVFFRSSDENENHFARWHDKRRVLWA